MHSRVSSEGKKTQTGTAQIYNWDLFLDVERFECLSPKTLSLPNGKGAHGHILSDFSVCSAFSIEDSVVQKILMPQCRISSRYIIKMSCYLNRQHMHIFNNRTLFSVSTHMLSKSLDRHDQCMQFLVFVLSSLESSVPINMPIIGDTSQSSLWC